jgi:hypothetical protein
MNLSVHHWLRIAIFNLLIVAFLGVTLRYKIVFFTILYRSKAFTPRAFSFCFLRLDNPGADGFNDPIPFGSERRKLF